jgi:hypothetical protein
MIWWRTKSSETKVRFHLYDYQKINALFIIPKQYCPCTTAFCLFTVAMHLNTKKREKKRMTATVG